MGFIRKDLQRHHICFTDPGKVINFGATPYEAVTFPVNAIPDLSAGLIWEGGSKVYGGFNGGSGNLRTDTRLTRATGSNLGWTLTHEARGRGLALTPFKENRAIATFISELADGGENEWANRSGGNVANSIIYAVNHRLGPNGLNVATIQSATPDYFLGNLELPTMSYIMGKPANRERKSWYDLCRYGFDTTKPWPSILPTSPELIKASAQNYLGYTFKDDSGVGINAPTPKYNDPLGGFGYYTDQYTLTVGEAMKPRPCNENHLFYKLSASRILVEILRNHVKANGRSIMEMFNMEILTQLDPEYNILTADISGTINSIIQELAQHGVWRAWWDSRCNFHFIPDYYTGYANNPVLQIIQGPSLLGELEVNPGTDQRRVNRAEVKGQPFISFGDADTDALSANVNMALGAVYPPGTPKGGVGSDVTMDNYMGRNSGEQARRMYNKANARTTFRWSNFPYPTLAFGLLNRPVAITATDPKLAWSFSGKLFVVTDADIQLTDADRPDGGYYLCSVSGIEI
jgi:hypothetical protein